MTFSGYDEAAGDWSATVRELGLETDRVADRLRRLPQARLARSLPGYGTVADAGRRLAQALADGAEGVAAGDRTPVWRALPALSDAIVGDQVAVTAAELREALALAVPDDPAWTRAGCTTVARLATDLLALAHATKMAVN